MVDIRLPSGQIISGIPEGMPREQIKQRIIESGVLRGGLDIPQQPTTGEIVGRQLRGAARDVAGFAPIVGGYADVAEAAVRSLVGPETREEELAKIREEQRQYEQSLEQAGVGGLRTAGQVAGGIAAGIPVLGGLGRAISGAGQLGGRAAQFAGTRLGQSLLGAGIGGVEAAGFADEDALTGGLTGAAVGAAVPVVGRGIARALGKTKQIAGKPIAKLTQTNEGTQTLIKGIDASPRLAEEIQPLAQRSLENTEKRVQNEALKALDVNKLEDIAGPARREYGEFMEANADKLIPMNKAKNLYKSRNIRTLSEQLRANNPDTFGTMPRNSIGFLQEVKSRAASRGRSVSEGAKDWQEASNKIKGFIDDNFVGFKDLNQKYAKMMDSEKLADKFVNPRAGETGNIAKGLLTTQNKRDLTKSFGSEKASRLVKALRKESEAHKNLSSVATKARNRAQDRGSLNVLLGGENRLRNLASGIPLGVGLYNPALAVGLGAGDIGLRLLSNRQARQAARRLLQGGAVADPRLNKLIQAISAETAGQIGE